MSESSTEQISPDEVATVAPGRDPEAEAEAYLEKLRAERGPIEVDLEAERAQAAAASEASRAASTPRDPRRRDPNAPEDPVARVAKALAEAFDRELSKTVSNYTPVALPMGAMARAALAEMTGLPTVPPYDEYDSPRERFYDHRTPQLDLDEYYIPAGAAAGNVAHGGMPVGRSAAVTRTIGADGADVVAMPVRPAGGADQDPELTLEFPLRTAQDLALAMLAATWADPPRVDE